jgi:hypothetical protein
MLVLIHVNKEQTTWIEANSAQAGAEPPVPPIEWCTRSSGGGSDHVVVLYDLERLVKELLPHFAIAPTSVPSFVCKLCRWGFRQVSAVYGCVRKNFSNRPHTSHMYKSEHFRCGNFALLTRMNSDTAEKRRYEASIAAASDGLGADTGDEPSRVESRASPVQSTTNRNLTSRLSGPTERKRPRSDEGSHRAGTSPEFRGTQNRAARLQDVMAHPPAAPDVTSLTSVHQLMNQYPLAPMPVVGSRLLSGTGHGAAASLGVGAAAYAQGSLYGSLQQQEQDLARLAVGNQVYIAEQGGVVPNYQRVGLGTVQLNGSPTFHVLLVSSVAGAQQNAWMVPAAAGTQQNAWMVPVAQSQVGLSLNQYHLPLVIQQANLNAPIVSPPQLVMPQLMIGQGRRELTIQELMLLLQSASPPPDHPR